VRTGRPRVSLEERFASRYAVDPETGCWLWTGATSDSGYAALREGGAASRRLLAHRVSYEIHVGPIPEGLQIDHLCRVRHCVNPAHLEAVTPLENARRVIQRPGGNARYGHRTHCDHGHEFTVENTTLRYVRGQYHGRRCKACRPRRDASGHDASLHLRPQPGGLRDLRAGVSAARPGRVRARGVQGSGVSTLAVEPRFTFDEWKRIVSDPHER
jgi:hypothetical protein